MNFDVLLIDSISCCVPSEKIQVTEHLFDCNNQSINQSMLKNCEAIFATCHVSNMAKFLCSIHFYACNIKCLNQTLELNRNKSLKHDDKFNLSSCFKLLFFKYILTIQLNKYYYLTLVINNHENKTCFHVHA